MDSGGLQSTGLQSQTQLTRLHTHTHTHTGTSLVVCLEGVPDLPVAPQDEAGLTKTFQTWPRGWFHIP